MPRIVLGVEYQGSHYCGWQFQDHCDSVQHNLQQALSFIANETIGVQCAGRTDTGVHAVGQVVHFDTQATRPHRAWLEGTNTKLPDDIRVSWVKVIEGDFHARFSAVSRQYRYVIFNRSVHSAVLAKRVTWQTKPLDADLMQEAAQALMGEHDFSSFRASGCQAKHAVRTIQSLSVSRRGDFVFVDIQANAFLHHMVRNIVGSLMQVGYAEKPVSYISELIKLKDRKQAGVTAPAAGLYFVNAIYSDEWSIPQVKVDEVLWG